MTWTNPSGGAPRTLKKQALARDNHQCVKCGSQKHLEIDHIHNVAAGGTHSLANLQTLCHKCHKKKTHHEATAWRRKTKRQPRTPIGLN